MGFTRVPPYPAGAVGAVQQSGEVEQIKLAGSCCGYDVILLTLGGWSTTEEKENLQKCYRCGH